MDKEMTELVFILDKSGSMSGLETDTIGGYNSMLEKQKELEGRCRVSTVLFNQQYELLHDRIDLPAVNPISETDYQVGGSTALLDAIGHTINKIVQIQKQTAEAYRANRVLFVIITDGEENSSREFTAEKVRQMIEDQKSGSNWEFIFLGANIDVVQTASRYGINPDRAVPYLSDREGTQLNYNVMSEAVKNYRRSGVVQEADFDAIRADAKKRGKKKL